MAVPDPSSSQPSSDVSQKQAQSVSAADSQSTSSMSNEELFIACVSDSMNVQNRDYDRSWEGRRNAEQGSKLC